jgi:ABC-type lipoprotein release transport system permease subunit
MTRLIGSMLYGVDPADPVTHIGVAVLMFAATSLASYLPARRAAHIDPVNALRAH